MATYLVLENGSVYQGSAFGSIEDTSGEVVFQTGHVGYVESLTDSSYRKQILVLTHPLIGNYGVPDTSAVDEHGVQGWVESHRIWAAGLIVGELSKLFSHFNAQKSLDHWLQEHNIPGIEGIDTRALTKQLRTAGTLLGRLIHDPLKLNLQIELNSAELANQIKQLKSDNPNAENLVEQVSTKERKVFNSTGKVRVMMVDCGVKYNQIRCFLKRNVRIELVPWDYKFQERLDEFDGLFLSNDPGDPIQCKQAIENLKAMLTLAIPKPIFGICLGHQLLSLSAGAKNVPCLFNNIEHPLRTSSLSVGYQQSVLSVEPSTRYMLRNLFDLVNDYKSYDESKPMDHILRDTRFGCLLYENSTRTGCSFEAATKELGGQLNGLNVQTSSLSKSFEHTVSMTNYNPLLIIRHNEPGATERAVTKVPINAGIAEHPTQSLPEDPSHFKQPSKSNHHHQIRAPEIFCIFFFNLLTFINAKKSDESLTLCVNLDFHVYILILIVIVLWIILLLVSILSNLLDLITITTD